MELQQNTIKALDQAPKVDKYGRAYGTGRRKVAVARVWIKRKAKESEKGKITINGRTPRDYFQRETLLIDINKPFAVTNNLDQFDVYCTIVGGGLAGQAGAMRHGISRALNNFDPMLYHADLRKNGLLTRDSRMVESKKYGRHKARRSTQFSKR